MNVKREIALHDASASGANGSPGALLAVRGPFTPVSGWNTVTMSPVVLNPGTYWLAYEVSSNSMTFNVQNSSGTLVWVAKPRDLPKQFPDFDKPPNGRLVFICHARSPSYQFS